LIEVDQWFSKWLISIPRGKTELSKGLIDSQGVKWGSLNGQGSMNNCWGLLET